MSTIWISPGYKHDHWRNYACWYVAMGWCGANTEDFLLGASVWEEQSKQPRSWIPSGEKLQHREKHWPAPPLGIPPRVHRSPGSPTKGPHVPSQPSPVHTMQWASIACWDRSSFANFVIKIGTESCQEVNGRIWRSRAKVLIKISWFSTANLFSSLYQDHKLFFVSKYCLWTPLIECHPIWYKA